MSSLGKRMNRGNEALFETVIFLILNILFILLMLVFVGRAGTSVGVYEEKYAKQAALFIDAAKPGMQLMIDFSKGKEIAGKRGYTGSLLDVDKNKGIIVHLTGGGGYRYNFFSDYNVDVHELKSAGGYYAVLEVRG